MSKRITTERKRVRAVSFACLPLLFLLLCMHTWRTHHVRVGCSRLELSCRPSVRPSVAGSQKIELFRGRRRTVPYGVDDRPTPPDSRVDHWMTATMTFRSSFQLKGHRRKIRPVGRTCSLDGIFTDVPCGPFPFHFSFFFLFFSIVSFIFFFYLCIRSCV